MKKALYQMEMEKRNQFYLELSRYTIFLALLLFVLLTLPVHFRYEQTETLRDLFFDEEVSCSQQIRHYCALRLHSSFQFPTVTNFKKNFYDVMVEQEMWQWVEGPFLGGLYDDVRGPSGLTFLLL